jgi:hypothetical protein
MTKERRRSPSCYQFDGNDGGDSGSDTEIGDEATMKDKVESGASVNRRGTRPEPKERLKRERTARPTSTREKRGLAAEP